MDDPTLKLAGLNGGLGLHDPAQRLRCLWRDRQPPYLQAFLTEAGELETPQVLVLLRIDQRERWLSGERVPLETYLELYPALRDDPDHFLDLVYGEFLLREQLGERPALAEYEERFPELAEELRLQLEVHRLVAPDGSVPTLTQPVALASANGGRDEALPLITGYRLVGRLGHGGMAVVFKAWQEGLNRFVALKMIDGRGCFDPDQRARFRAEAAMAARLHHPNIVQIYEVGEQNGWPYFSLELVDGGSLAQRFGGQPQPPRCAAALVRTLARAVAHAHQQGIVHRDLKPGNVLLSPKPEGEATALDGWEPKIADFGLARYLDADGSRTRSGAILGTPNYMAPEQAAGQARHIGPATDIYGLGALLYELLTGRPPFAAATVLETMELVRTQEPAAPAQLNARVPRDLETICLKCLQKEQSQRYASASELADELERFLEHRPIVARPVGPLTRCGRWCRRNPAVAALAVAVALVFVVGVLATGFFALRVREESQSAAQQAAEAQRAQQAADAQLYVADMRLAQQAWEQSQLGHLRTLLDRHRPGADDATDRRGFEWHYWNRLCNGGPLTLRGHQGRVRAVAFSPDGRRLATTGDESAVRLWDTATGRQLFALRGHQPGPVFLAPVGPDIPVPGYVNAVAFTPDGRCLVTAGSDGTVRLWDLDRGREAAVLTGHTDRVMAVAIHPDGRLLASASDDHTVRLWDIAARRETRVLRDHTHPVCDVVFSPDGRSLFSGGKDTAVYWWNVADGRRLHGCGLLGMVPLRLAVSPDGRQLAFGGRGPGIVIWDLEKRQHLRTLPCPGQIVCGLAFGPDGQLASSGTDQGVRVWDPAAGRLLRTCRGHTALVWNVAFSSDGRRMASVSEDGTAQLWESDAAAEAVSLRPHDHWVTSVAWSPDGRWLASSSGDKTARVWEAATGHVTCTLRHDNEAVSQVAFAPDSRRLATAGFDYMVRLWDPADGRALAVLRGHAHRVVAVVFSPDGRLIASGARDRTVRLWDATDGRLLRTLEGHEASIPRLEFSPDGRLLVSACRDGTIKVWEVESGRLLRTFDAHRQAQQPLTIHYWTLGFGLAISSDGRRVASTMHERRILVWDVGTGREEFVLEGHTEQVNRLVFSPDGQRLVSAGDDLTIRFWEMKTGQEVLTLRGHAKNVTSLAFHPDGRRLVSGDSAGQLKCWNANYLSAAR